MNHITSLHEVATKISIGETVDVIVYIDLRQAEPVTINTQYGIKKEQVIPHDNSYSRKIKLTLWNAHIDSIAKNGVYKLQCAKGNSLNGKYLTTTEALADIEIKEVQTSSTFENVSFLPETLNLFQPSHFCKECKRKTQPIGVFVISSIAVQSHLSRIHKAHFSSRQPSQRRMMQKPC